MKRHVSLRRHKPLPSINRERQAQRRKAYASHLRSPYFRALRLERFALDGWQCATYLTTSWERSTDGSPPTCIFVRCGYIDESRTGKGLHAHHKTYARFGHELVDDLATACASCHRSLSALQGKRIRP